MLLSRMMRIVFVALLFKKKLFYHSYIFMYIPLYFSLKINFIYLTTIIHFMINYNCFMHRELDINQEILVCMQKLVRKYLSSIFFYTKQNIYAVLQESPDPMPPVCRGNRIFLTVKKLQKIYQGKHFTNSHKNKVIKMTYLKVLY